MDQAVRGHAGEAMARLFLETRGYRVLAERMRVGRHELDLVLERGELLVVVEVKWRRVGAGSAGAEERALLAWRPSQRARAHAAVLALMPELPHGAERPWRFDLVVIEEDAKGVTLTHHRGAWSPGGSFW